MNIFKQQLINITIRTLGLIAKLILVFFLARYLEPADLGQYGILYATIMYFTYILGFEFYMYSTREIIATVDSDRWYLLRDQGVFFIFTYVNGLLVGLLLFYLQLIPKDLLYWFYPLLVTEHISSELNRLLTALSKALVVGILLFIRTASWIFLIAILFLFVPESRNLQTVLGIWLLFSFGTCLVSIIYLLKVIPPSREKKDINWGWIINGIRISFPFFISSLAIGGLSTIDRYGIDYLSGLEVLGAYVFFIGITNAMISFMDSGIFAFYYPKLVLSFQENNKKLFFESFRKMTIQVLAFSLIFSISILAINDWLLLVTDNIIYKEYNHFLPWLLLAFTLKSFGALLQYALYSYKHDKPIIYSNFLSLPMFLLFVFLIKDRFNSLSIPISLVMTYATILIWKLYFWLKIKELLK